MCCSMFKLVGRTIGPAQYGVISSLPFCVQLILPLLVDRAGFTIRPQVLLEEVSVSTQTNALLASAMNVASTAVSA